MCNTEDSQVFGVFTSNKFNTLFGQNKFFWQAVWVYLILLGIPERSRGIFFLHKLEILGGGGGGCGVLCEIPSTARLWIFFLNYTICICRSTYIMCLRQQWLKKFRKKAGHLELTKAGICTNEVINKLPKNELHCKMSCSISFINLWSECQWSDKLQKTKKLCSSTVNVCVYCLQIN